MGSIHFDEREFDHNKLYWVRIAPLTGVKNINVYSILGVGKVTRDDKWVRVGGAATEVFANVVSNGDMISEARRKGIAWRVMPAFDIAETKEECRRIENEYLRERLRREGGTAERPNSLRRLSGKKEEPSLSALVSRIRRDNAAVAVLETEVDARVEEEMAEMPEYHSGVDSNDSAESGSDTPTSTSGGTHAPKSGKLRPPRRKRK